MDDYEYAIEKLREKKLRKGPLIAWSILALFVIVSFIIAYFFKSPGSVFLFILSIGSIPMFILVTVTHFEDGLCVSEMQELRRDYERELHRQRQGKRDTP